ncbi:MAG: DUF523 domain-containing protein [Eggerthellales bacterium]|nr:DUF523 domain-containing protein [Eggerthellales bacterium]
MRIAVSVCLLGEPCRYDGQSASCASVAQLGEEHILVPVCPEVMGGLPTPRDPSEIQMAAGRPEEVLNARRLDVTAWFRKGAEEAVSLALDQECVAAVLKQRSPSCGTSLVYDGTFSGTVVAGAGLTARLMRERGIPVFDESQIGDLLSFLGQEPSTC